MKAIKIKYQKILMGIFICLFGVVTFAQNTTQKDKLSYHFFSLTPLEVFFTDFSGGLAITGELGYAVGQNLFIISGSIGEEYAIWGRGHRFQQLNLLYGREFEIVDRLFADAHAGLGLFRLSDDRDSDTTLGLPMVIKLRYRTGDKFSIGLKFQANINSVENIYSVGLLLQWNKI